MRTYVYTHTRTHACTEKMENTEIINTGHAAGNCQCVLNSRKETKVLREYLNLRNTEKGRKSCSRGLHQISRSTMKALLHIFLIIALMTTTVMLGVCGNVPQEIFKRAATKPTLYRTTPRHTFHISTPRTTTFHPSSTILSTPPMPLGAPAIIVAPLRITTAPPCPSGYRKDKQGICREVI